MRAVALVASALAGLVGCSPAVGEEDPASVDWMIGGFSEFRELPWGDEPVLAVRYQLDEDGSAEVIRVDCEQTRTPAEWKLQEDGSVRLEFMQDSRLVAVVLSPADCGSDGLAYYAAERRTRDSEASPTEGVSEIVLYRSHPCPGEFVPGEDCEDDGNECDPRGHCTVVWCDGGEPERCDE